MGGRTKTAGLPELYAEVHCTWALPCWPYACRTVDGRLVGGPGRSETFGRRVIYDLELSKRRLRFSRFSQPFRSFSVS